MKHSQFIWWTRALEDAVEPALKEVQRNMPLYTDASVISAFVRQEVIKAIDESCEESE